MCFDQSGKSFFKNWRVYNSSKEHFLRSNFSFLRKLSFSVKKIPYSYIYTFCCHLLDGRMKTHACNLRSVCQCYVKINLAHVLFDSFNKRFTIPFWINSFWLEAMLKIRALTQSAHDRPHCRQCQMTTQKDVTSVTSCLPDVCLVPDEPVKTNTSPEKNWPTPWPWLSLPHVSRWLQGKAMWSLFDLREWWERRCPVCLPVKLCAGKFCLF